MASVEPDLYSRCGECKNQKLLMPPQPTEVKSRIRVYQSPQIWSLEKKCSDAIHALQKKPVGSNAYHLCFDCHNTAPSTFPSSHLLTAHNTKSSRNLPERTFVFQRPVSGHKPYQKLESLCLRPKSVDQRPYSTSSPIRYPHSTPASYFGTTGAMTTSLMDQFLLPSATGDQLELSPRRPSSVVPKLPCESTRPSLNTNSFLRPSSAKVPLHPHQGNKKTYTCPVGTNSSSWHSGGTGELGQLNGNIQCLSHHCTTTLKFPQPPTSPNILQGSSRMEPTAWEILEHGSKMDTLPHRIHLTEAVKNLVQSRNVLKSNIAPHVEAASNMAFSKDTVLANCNKVTSPLCPGSQKKLIPGTYVSDGAFVNGSLNIASGAIDCAKLAVDANVSNPNIHRQTVSAPALKRESHQPAMLQKSQGVTITVMATQISTIHLDKTHRVPEIPVQSESVLHKLEQPLPNCELEGAEEELPDGLDDRQEEEEEEEEEDMEDEDGEDGDTPDGSLIYSSSDTLLSAVSRQCPENVPVNGGSVVRPALTNSLFPNMPQTVYFGTQDETVQRLPWAQRKLLKWRMSTVTPNVVKIAVTRSHFRVTKKNHDWLGCWGHHMKSTAFKTIQAHQKLNHFPGTFQIGRKDRLWRNLSKMQARFGRKEFNFFPQSFVLPQDIKLLKKAWEEGGTRQKWIVKPPASARGMGIQVIHKWSQLPKRRPLLVQRYLHKPYLISGSKFDLRIYVYVTSYDPLRIYLFSDGLVRFASCKYSSSMKSLSNKFMHLTNYSVNKKNVDYKANSDQTACQGHKWALKALWSYLNQHGFSSDKIWEKIKDMVIKTVIASEPYVNSLVKMYVQKPYSCHELFGFDIMLDENLKPWVLEVNISPSLHSNSQLDMNIKGQMVRDLFNLAGFVLPSKEDMMSGDGSACSSTNSVNGHGKVRCSAEVVGMEKMKRAHYLSPKIPDKDFYATILDQLTPEDVKVLAETEDEMSRCGQFERIFPSPISSRYLRFFEQPRYFNILTHQWEQKYYANREMGRDFLRSLCLMSYHTGLSGHTRMWAMPRSPGHAEIHRNGFSKAEVIKHSKVPVASDERLKSFSITPIHQNPGNLQHPDLCESHRLSQTLSSVPESTLVM